MVLLFVVVVFVEVVLGISAGIFSSTDTPFAVEAVVSVVIGSFNNGVVVLLNITDRRRLSKSTRVVVDKLLLGASVSVVFVSFVVVAAAVFSISPYAPP